MISGDGEGTHGLQETEANLRVRTASSTASCGSREERLETDGAAKSFGFTTPRLISCETKHTEGVRRCAGSRWRG
jgi:hypothetical protein